MPTSISQKDLEDAVEKLVAGPERTSRRLDAEQKRRVAYHEVGHALVAAYSKYADPVHKISIVPRGRAALGYTLQLPAADQFLLTKSALLDRIKGLLGRPRGRRGRVPRGEHRRGKRSGSRHRPRPANGLHVRHERRRRPVPLRQPAGRVSPAAARRYGRRECSEATFHRVDEEVKKILDQCYRTARAVLSEHRDQLDLVVEELLGRESLDAAAFNKLLGRPVPSDGAGAAALPPPQPVPSR